MTSIQIFDCFGLLKNSRQSVNDDDKVKLSTSIVPQNIVKVNESIRADYRNIIQDVCDEVGMGYVTCQRILTEVLKTHKIAANLFRDY